MKLTITNQAQFDDAVDRNLFATAIHVRLDNLPLVTAVPDMPAAIHVWLYNLPLVTAVPDMPAAIEVWLDGKRIK